MTAARPQAADVHRAGHTTDDLVYLTVPVERDKRGVLCVAGYPGARRGARGHPAASARIEPEVEDTGLDAMACRAITNYLAGELPDLRADLAPNARVSLPERKLKVTSIDEVTSAKPQARNRAAECGGDISAPGRASCMPPAG